MSEAARTPVLVGVREVLQRADDPQADAEPLQLMASALEGAGADAECPALLKRADVIYVVRGAWSYGDPGRALARALGADPKESVTTPYGGNYAQACVFEAARDIAAGRRSIALIAAAENGRTQGQAQKRGLSLVQTEAPGTPDRSIDEPKAIFHDAELARGMNSASDIFAIVECALRHSRGESHSDHAERIARLWARFSAAAEANPNAWIQHTVDAEKIGTAGPDNPMISHPYTRLMNANARVDMAAAVIVTSLATARESGVPDEKVVHLLAATEANDALFLSERAELDRSPAMRIAGARALELAGVSAKEVDHIDLYSCFPSAVEVAAAELGISEERPLTVTGGLTFGGGPLNSYSLHAIARMVTVLRADPGSIGLVSANGGWLAKHAFGLYSTRPAPSGFASQNLQAEIDALPRREALIDWQGPITIEAYTVAHRKGTPTLAHVACLTAQGQRTWATTSEPATLAAMMTDDFCGRPGAVDGAGNLMLESGRAPRD